jgi:hypothetical protein
MMVVEYWMMVVVRVGTLEMQPVDWTEVWTERSMVESMMVVGNSLERWLVDLTIVVEDWLAIMVD